MAVAKMVPTEGAVPLFDGVKTFSATISNQRNELGERVTAWLQATGVRIVDVVVSQSSDAEYHCLTITVFYWRPGRAR